MINCFIPKKNSKLYNISNSKKKILISQEWTNQQDSAAGVVKLHLHLNYLVAEPHPQSVGPFRPGWFPEFTALLWSLRCWSRGHPASHGYGQWNDVCKESQGNEKLLTIDRKWSKIPKPEFTIAQFSIKYGTYSGKNSLQGNSTPTFYSDSLQGIELKAIVSLGFLVFSKLSKWYIAFINRGKGGK